MDTNIQTNKEIVMAESKYRVKKQWQETYDINMSQKETKEDICLNVDF